MRNSRPLCVERLEDRTVPVTWGNPWPDAMHLTASFMPDGTAAGAQASNLFENLDESASTAAWQMEILRALQTWAVHGNVNVGLVADGGQAFGAPGRPQGDARFGDVRIGGFNLPYDVLAITNAFEVTGGTASGDVRFNTNAQFSIGGENGVDLFTAALHEAAHSFGLDHSDDSSSAVFATYQGLASGLTAEDVARFQELYGVRQGDVHEGASGNERLDTATTLQFITNGSLTSLQITGDVTSIDDADVYRLRAPLNLGNAQVHLRAEGLSLLNATVTVYDSRGRVIGSATSQDPLNNDLTISLSSMRALRTYYVKVEGASEDVFGIGSYELEVEGLSAVNSLLGWLGGTVDDVTEPLLNDDLHTDDSFLTASLLPRLNETGSSFDYAFRGSIRDGWDVDYYQIQAPAQLGDSDVLTVMAWGLENGGLAPKVSVYDANQQLVASDTLVNADGFFAIQVLGVEAGARYYLKVEAMDSGGSDVGNYFLGADFSAQAVELEVLSEGTLSGSETVAQEELILDQTQQRHFVLSASGDASTIVQVTVRNLAGATITSFAVRAGAEAVSQTVRLQKGKYLIEVSARSADGGPAGETTYLLKSGRLSDPIGPQPADPTEDPAMDAESPPPAQEEPTSSPPPSEEPSEPNESQDPNFVGPPPPSEEPSEPNESQDPNFVGPPPPSESEQPQSPPPSEPAYEEEETYYNSYQSEDHRLGEAEPADDPYQPAP